MTRRAQEAGLPVVALRHRHFWRCIPRQYLATALEAGPSFTRQRRYSVRGEFSALYFSASRELSRTEVASRTGQDSEAMSCVEFEITTDRLVDLTRPGTRNALQIRLEDLVRPRVSAGAYDVPQRIARRVYQEGFGGLLVPSVYDPMGGREDWFNLVLYPANIMRVFVREVEIAAVTVPLR